MTASLSNWLTLGFYALLALALAYLARVNHILKGVPREVRKLRGPPWTPSQLRKTYRDLDNKPIDYTSKLPPRLHRRYIVTGGNGKPN